jgi:hypothetical protein
MRLKLGKRIGIRMGVGTKIWEEERSYIGKGKGVRLNGEGKGTLR